MSRQLVYSYQDVAGTAKQQIIPLQRYAWLASMSQGVPCYQILSWREAIAAQASLKRRLIHSGICIHSQPSGP